MKTRAVTRTLKLHSLSIVGMLLLLGACVGEPKATKQGGQTGGSGGSSSDLRRDAAADAPLSATGGSGGSNTGGSGSLPRTGGSTTVSTGGAGGRIDGGSIDGGGGMDGASRGPADAAIDSVSPALLGIGGFAPYKLGPRNGGGPFYCPRMMMFSPEMNQAALDDAIRYGWPIGSFYYGVATLNGAPCCSCWQIVFDVPENSSIKYEPPRPLIIQMFNSGGNDGAFDIYLGKGGLGLVPRCPAMYQTFPMVGENFGGGIRASNIAACGKTQETLATQACVDAVTKACNEIVGKNDYVTNVTRNSCVVGNKAGTMYHENFKVKARMVECPQAMSDITGCKLKPGNNPKPDPTVQTAAQAASWKSYSTTTMQDCSAATCAWPNNVQNTESPWTAEYLCDEMGVVNAKPN